MNFEGEGRCGRIDVIKGITIKLKPRAEKKKKVACFLHYECHFTTRDVISLRVILVTILSIGSSSCHQSNSPKRGPLAVLQHAHLGTVGGVVWSITGNRPASDRATLPIMFLDFEAALVLHDHRAELPVPRPVVVPSCTSHLMITTTSHVPRPRNSLTETPPTYLRPVASLSSNRRDMPQDPNLYGQRAPKRQKKETALPSSLAFSAELASLISTSKSSSNKKSTTADPLAELAAASTSSSAARPRPSKSKPDIFAGVRSATKRKPNSNSNDEAERARGGGAKLVLKDVHGTEDDKNELAAARRKMEEKARLYAAMKRGDYVPREGEAASLVDFDKKWAEAHDPGEASGSSSEEDEDEDDNIDTEIIEYTDEFGRTRRGTRAEQLRQARRAHARDYTAAELERMSARPKAPERVIYGDAIQADAFRAVDEDAMEALARKRDRSLTPPEMKHYEADREIRTKGVGFFQFSKDEETRTQEMANLAAERENTERERQRREEEKDVRRREVEERRRVIEERRRQAGEKRARKMADSFLDGLAADLGGGGDGTAVEEQGKGD